VALAAQSAGSVLLVVNEADNLSRRIGDYYARKRSLPARNVCRLVMSSKESIDWETYQAQVEHPIAAYLVSRLLADRIVYLVTTAGVPLRVTGPGTGQKTESAALDSELALLYGKMRGVEASARAGVVNNPFFGRVGDTFEHPAFPIYLVTRLAGYDFEDVRGMIDRAAQARNRGKFVIDLKGNDNTPGDGWLRAAAKSLPPDRVVLEETGTVLYNQPDVIGYASWGSNDHGRHDRFLHFGWLPGAVATEFVSTNGRTFERPPDTWNLSSWSRSDKPLWFFGSPQTLSADYIHEGATGCSGHVDEPYLNGTPRPDYLLPAYFHGRNLAESYYLAIPVLSWQNIVLGDPLCRIGEPEGASARSRSVSK
jgi:uncharacterized protein (TIGR03790 family)